MDEKEATQKVIRSLKKDLLPFTPFLISWTAKKLGIEEAPELVRGVLAEGVKEAVGAIEKFLDAIGVPHRPNLSTLEEHLWNDGEVEVSPVLRNGKWGVDIRVEDSNKKRVGSWHYTSPAVASLRGLKLHTTAGLVRLENNYVPDIAGKGFFYVEGDSAFFKAPVEEGPHIYLEALRSLKPFLPAIGHEGLPEALEALGKLEKGESGLEGRYVLARGEDFWALKEWPIMGDPALDGAILLEKEVSLNFPGDVEISFKVLWDEAQSSELAYVHFRLGEESLRIDSPQNWRPSNKENIVTHLIQEAVKKVFEEAEKMRMWGMRGDPLDSLESLSPRMLAFLRAFMEHETPFEALANGTLFSYATAELFRDI
jgi:hypothetical protein